MARLKRLAGIFGSIGFGILLAIIMLEIIGRVLHLVPAPLPESYQEVREVVGRFPEPYSYFWFNREDGERIWVQFNQRSLRDIDHADEKKSDTTRIMFLGDSYTAGWQVPLTETYTGRLRDWNSDNYEFINAGLHGWGTDRQLLYYQRDGYRFDNDVVVLQFYVGNDILDNGIAVLQERELEDGRRIVTYPVGTDRPYYTLDNNGELELTTPTWLPPTRVEGIGGVRSFLRHYSFTYALVEQLTQLVKGFISSEDAQERPTYQLRFNELFPIDYYAFSPESETEDDWQAAWDISKALIRQLREEVESSGAEFLVMVVDVRWQHDPEGFENLRETWDIPDDWQPDRWGHIMRDFLDEENIPYLTVLDDLLAYHEETGQAIILKTDGHWTSQGQCVVAVELNNWLLEREIFQDSALERDELSSCNK